MEGSATSSDRPEALLLRATEMHAAIRDGVPVIPLDGPVCHQPSTSPVTTGSGSRRAPRKRKQET